MVEDIAESFIGNQFIGNPDAIMSLFSFGSIKKYTAFGGALAFVRDKEVYNQIVAIHDTFTFQTKIEYQV